MSSGKAVDTLAKMVKAQGGNENWVYDTTNFPKAKYSEQVVAPSSGYIYSVDTESYGVAALLLGAGRNTKDDVIDYSAGIILAKKTGDVVTKGDVIATLYTNKQETMKQAKEKFLSATVISNDKPDVKPLILGKVE